MTASIEQLPDTVGRDDVHPRSWIANATRAELVVNIMGRTDAEQAHVARLRELMEQREQALAREEAALELARQYAERAGVDISREDALKFASDYWTRRGRQEADWQLLEGQRWEALRLARELDDKTFTCTADELAARVSAILARTCSAQGMTKRKPGDLDFECPTAPGGAG